MDGREAKDRLHAAFAAGHIPGALSVPLGEFDAALGRLSRRSEIVAYCRGPYCVLAPQAIERLPPEATGPAAWSTVSLDGGWRACPSQPEPISRARSLVD